MYVCTRLFAFFIDCPLLILFVFFRKIIPVMKSSERYAPRVRDAQRRKRGEGDRETAVEESKKETADGVARPQAE